MNNMPNMPQMPEVPAMDLPATDVPTTNVSTTNASATQPNTATSTQNTGNQNTINIVGRVSFPSTQLFEATGFIDISRSFPNSNAFLMFVPGKPDNTKATGRTYDQNQKETMKVSTRDLYALAEALKFAALYKKNPGFTIFTDSSKFAGNQGQGVTKNITVSVAPSSKDPNKFTIFLSYKGQQKITLAMEEWHAIGLASQLSNLANITENKKFEIEKQLMNRQS